MIGFQIRHSLYILSNKNEKKNQSNLTMYMYQSRQHFDDKLFLYEAEIRNLYLHK